MPLPTVLSRVARRARALLRRRAVEHEMAEEMAMHLEFEIEDRIRQGMSPSEARRTALRDFGGVERYKDEARGARGVLVIHDLVQDVNYALRVLRQSPGFTVTSVFTVAIGIAATTTVLSVANTVLFRPPPVVAPERLVVVAEVWKSGERSWETSMGQYMYRYDHYRDLREASQRVFNGLAGFRYGSVALRVGDEARPVSSLAVSANYFDVLGLHPALGRFFDASQERSGIASAAVVGHDFWVSALAGDPSAVGKSITVDGRSFTIIGVAPSGFTGTSLGLAADVWLPTTEGSFTMIGRIAPGLSRKRAVEELTTIGQRLPTKIAAQRIVRMTLDPIAGVPRMSRGAAVGFVGMLVVAAMLVLLIVATNIAGMFLARAAHRRREVAVRLALGASRGRMVRQLLTESMVLCLLGGVLGVLLANGFMRGLPPMDLPIGPRLAPDFRPDERVLAVSFLFALLTGVIAGLTPALQSIRVDVLSLLRGVRDDGRRGISRVRGGFVVVQLAMALVLLLTGGLFVRAVQHGAQIDRGLTAERVVVAEVTVGPHGYDRTRGAAFYAELATRLRARPELRAVGLGQWTPLSTSHMGQGITTRDGGHLAVTWGIADAGFVETMRIPVVAGRSFDASDTERAHPVVVVNETLAQRMWPGVSPIGQRLELRGSRGVVGVIHDGKYRRLDEGPTAFALIPASQFYSDRMTIYAQARGDLAAGLSAVRAEVAGLNRNIALERAGSLSEQLTLYVLPQRIAAWCMGMFGVFGLGLAALGIYGVIAYYAAQRTKEMGIRMALGAEGVDILRELLRPAVRVVAFGIVIGVAISAATARLARGLLYGVDALDPLTFGTVPVALGLIAVTASSIAAWRAIRANPVASLRID